MRGVSTFDAVRGRYVPAIPEPFWERSWQTLFLWRPRCIECQTNFKHIAAYREHYKRHHMEPEAA